MLLVLQSTCQQALSALETIVRCVLLVGTPLHVFAVSAAPYPCWYALPGIGLLGPSNLPVAIV